MHRLHYHEIKLCWNPSSCKQIQIHSNALNICPNDDDVLNKKANAHHRFRMHVFYHDAEHFAHVASAWSSSLSNWSRLQWTWLLSLFSAFNPTRKITPKNIPIWRKSECMPWNFPEILEITWKNWSNTCFFAFITLEAVYHEGILPDFENLTLHCFCTVFRSAKISHFLHFNSIWANMATHWRTIFISNNKCRWFQCSLSSMNTEEFEALSCCFDTFWWTYKSHLPRFCLTAHELDYAFR